MLAFLEKIHFGGQIVKTYDSPGEEKFSTPVYMYKKGHGSRRFQEAGRAYSRLGI